MPKLEKELGFNPAQLYIMDITGIECYVKENNPKFFNALVKKLQHLNIDKYLFENHGILPVIALNPRNTKQNFGKPGFNEYGILTSSKNPSITPYEVGWLLQR